MIGAGKYADPKIASNPMTTIPQDILAKYSMGRLSPELTQIQATYYGQSRAG